MSQIIPKIETSLEHLTRTQHNYFYWSTTLDPDFVQAILGRPIRDDDSAIGVLICETCEQVLVAGHDK